MKERGKRPLWTGVLFVVLFVVWTVLVRTVDVRDAGPMRTDIGFAAINLWFHKLTGVHMLIYTITDWMGFVPLFICLMFAAIGLRQMIRRKSLRKVDFDILLLGGYYLLIILGYLIFEIIPVNYRPVLIEGRLEASYPSSTTLLVLSVMPTLVFQANRRLHGAKAKKAIALLTIMVSLSMVIGRLISGVHWLTDIVGAVLLSTGLFCFYQAAVIVYYKEE